MTAAQRLLLAAPMRIEARLVRSGARGAHVHRTGMGPRRAMQAASVLAGLPGDALLVIGFCGALESGLQPGEIVVADRVHAATDEGHAELSILCPGAGELADILIRSGLQAEVAPVVSVGRLALGERRRQLREEGALAVDMESVWLAAGAGRRPFAVVRVVLDTPERELFRPQMAPLALRAGRVLRQAARALHAGVAEHGLHTLWPEGAPTGTARAPAGMESVPTGTGEPTDGGGESEV
jgi:4-hydroxy-3-methylbut-2-enyl diphosphate reductase